MTKIKTNARTKPDFGDMELARHLFHIFYGRDPEDELSLLRAESVGQQAAKPRDALLRHFLLTDEFQSVNRDFYAFFLDQILRRRVFAGFRVPKVNLFFVGTSRAGTTTLARCLEKHSNICVSPVKETNFFSNFSKSVSESGVPEDFYELYFPNWNKQKIIADFTPNYLSSISATTAIHQYNSSSKIIVSLRDPVERAISDYFYLKGFHGVDNIFNFFEEAINIYSKVEVDKASWFSAVKILRRGRYFNDVQRYATCFPEQLKIVEFNRIFDLQPLLEDICDFVGVALENNMVPPRGKEIENASAKDSDDLDSVRAILRNFYYDDVEKTQNDFQLTICDWV